MKNKKELFLIVIILVISATLRFFNLMHGSPYFFNPDERNMANAISQFRLPSDLSQIPICLISQISPIMRNDPGSSPRSNDPGSSSTANCNLNPHFFAYGQFPLYLAFISDQVIQSFWQVPLNGTHPESQWDPGQARMTTFPSAIFWLRFWSALSSTLTVLLVYLISKKLINNYLPNFSFFIFHFSFLAALMAAFSPGLIQSAHFGTTESLLAFFFFASVYLSLRLFTNPLSLRSASWRRSNLYKLLEIATVASLPRNDIILLSLSIGLALGSKLTGVFFFVPPLSSLMVQIIKLFTQRISKKKKFICLFAYLLICLLVLIGSILVFILSSPYNLIEPENFKSAVFGYESDIATGKYEAFYTRQFVNTIPILFQAEKIFPYALGWPVFILGSIGFLLITIQLIVKYILLTGRKLQITNYKLQINGKINNLKIYNSFIILNLSFIIYLLPNSSLFAKWTRFMTPILPFFSIFAAYFLFQISKLFRCHSDPPTGGEESLANARPLRQAERSLTSFGMTKSVLTFAFLFLAILPGIAFMSIYTHEDTRITASKWIYNNIPNNSYILSETANVVDIPVGMKESVITKNYTVISFDFYHLDESPILFNQLLTHLEKANYIFIPSRRIFANYLLLPQKFPLITKYYQLLFSGRLGFEKVAEISSFPQLPISQIGQIRLIINDESAEETLTVFDHPVIRIYKKVSQLTIEQYRSLFKI